MIISRDIYQFGLLFSTYEGVLHSVIYPYLGSHSLLKFEYACLRVGMIWRLVIFPHQHQKTCKASWRYHSSTLFTQILVYNILWIMEEMNFIVAWVQERCAILMHDLTIYWTILDPENKLKSKFQDLKRVESHFTRFTRPTAWLRAGWECFGRGSISSHTSDYGD